MVGMVEALTIDQDGGQTLRPTLQPQRTCPGDALPKMRGLLQGGACLVRDYFRGVDPLVSLGPADPEVLETLSAGRWAEMPRTGWGVTREGKKGRVYAAVENEADGRLDRLAPLAHTLGGFEWPGVVWRPSPGTRTTAVWMTRVFMRILLR